MDLVVTCLVTLVGTIVLVYSTWARNISILEEFFRIYLVALLIIIVTSRLLKI